MNTCSLFSYDRRFFISVFVLVISSCLPTPFAYGERLTLGDGIKAVTQDSRIVKINEQEEAVARSDSLVARSGLLPKADGIYTANYKDQQPGAIFNNQSVPMAEKSYYQYSLSIQQLLFDFGGVSSHYGASRRMEETKRLNTKVTKNAVALGFALAYYGLLESEKMVNVAAKEKTRVEEHLTNAKSLFEEGVITRNDLLQAEVRLSDAKQRLITAQNLRRVSHSRLNTMLARPLSTVIDPEEPQMPFREEIGLDEAQGRAEKDRGEVKIVDTTLEAVRLEESAKKSEYYPRFFMEGRYDFMKNKYQVHEGVYSIMVGMNINFFSGGSTRAGLSKLGAQKERLLVEKRKLLDDIRLEVEQYYLGMIDGAEKIKVTKSAIAQAEDNLKINKAKYVEGAGTATDVTDAITLLTVAETNYFRAVYEYNRAYAGLMYAVGKDLGEIYR